MMMKQILLITTLFANSILLFSTRQTPDILHYKGEKLTLSTGWGHPSPLETYFTQNNLDYPFSAVNTANYRGHIAVWEITDHRFFLKRIKIKQKTYKPSEFNVKSQQSNSIPEEDMVFADWFTGVIIAKKRDESNYWKVNKSYYFYVRHGKIREVQDFTKNDFKVIRNISGEDSVDPDLKDKISILQLNNNYISYYFRLTRDDTIIFDGKGGYLRSKSGLSPILLHYDNDHLKWPYNWENQEKSGAPFCKWIVKSDSLLLSDIELHSGTGFYSIKKFQVNLTEVFPKRIDKNHVFADWVSGILIIRHGQNPKNGTSTGYYDFEASKLTLMKLQDGIILEQYTIPADLDIDDLPKDADKGLRQMLKKLE